MRTDVSLLLANGHPHAKLYPLAHVWSEARLVRRREAERMQKEAMILVTAIGNVLAGGNHFNELLRKIGDVG